MEIRSRIWRIYNTMDKGKRKKYKQLPIYKRLHRKLKIERHTVVLMYMIDYFVSVVYIRYMYRLWLIDGDTRYSAEVNSIVLQLNTKVFWQHPSYNNKGVISILIPQHCVFLITNSPSLSLSLSLSLLQIKKKHVLLSCLYLCLSFPLFFYLHR
jgi:hypothetical protein